MESNRELIDEVIGVFEHRSTHGSHPEGYKNEDGTIFCWFIARLQAAERLSVPPKAFVFLSGIVIEASKQLGGDTQGEWIRTIMSLSPHLINATLLRQDADALEITHVAKRIAENILVSCGAEVWSVLR
eukprot:GHVS01104133.1.p2 GENE.GHVS01104133.1~~GHVS01104133.1.p2  ORF type:complete len:129 (-),score=6.62 GHVS01104133.1:824-1210(-)